MPLRPVLLAILVTSCILAGCSGGTGSDDDQQPNGSDQVGGNQTRPDPLTLVDRSQASGDIPTAPNPYAKTFQVEAPYNELVISLHVSGAGQYQAVVRDANGTAVYDSKMTNTASPPDSHSTAGSGTTVSVEPGEFTATVDWTGAVTYHFTVLARVHGDADGGEHDH